MIKCIFTLDYEIRGDGQGSLGELILAPAERLKRLFDRAGAKMVVFVEVAELEMIASQSSDPDIGAVERQVHEFYHEGHEVALHLHPQWYNAQWRNDQWRLDYDEYNLCTLPKDRIVQIVDRALFYLRSLVGDPTFTPTSFRGGNWLLQPTAGITSILSERGIKIDSSVFKGGLQRKHGLDYRPALKNGSYWTFLDDVNVPDEDGPLWELPIHTRMVPFWKMLTGKRVGLQQKSAVRTKGPVGSMLQRLDYARPLYPLKFDFCRMTRSEMSTMVDSAIRDSRRQPDRFTPLVSIGHTKDLVDEDAVSWFLDFLNTREVGITTLADALPYCASNAYRSANHTEQQDVEVAAPS